MKLNQYELSIIGLIIIIFLSLGNYSHYLIKPTPEKVFENKIDRAESYCNEAKAISLSMPLLNDSIIGVYDESLFLMTVTLNHDWVLYVKSQNNFNDYTEEIANLNKKLGELRFRYNHELFMRELDRTIQKNKKIQRELEVKFNNLETTGKSI